MLSEPTLTISKPMSRSISSGIFSRRSTILHRQLTDAKDVRQMLSIGLGSYAHYFDLRVLWCRRHHKGSCRPSVFPGKAVSAQSSHRAELPEMQLGLFEGRGIFSGRDGTDRFGSFAAQEGPKGRGRRAHARTKPWS